MLGFDSACIINPHPRSANTTLKITGQGPPPASQYIKALHPAVAAQDLLQSSKDRCGLAAEGLTIESIFATLPGAAMNLDPSAVLLI